VTAPAAGVALAPARLPPAADRAVEDFRGFYKQVVVIRDEIRASTRDPEKPDAPPPTAAPPGEAEVRQRLRKALPRPDGPPAAGEADAVDTRYVMVAVADEVLLRQCPGWPGRLAWAEQPLEHTLYRTRLAGERIFSAARELASGRREDPAVAAVILLTLQLGFRGRYPDDADRDKITLAKNEVFGCLFKTPYSSGVAPPSFTAAFADTVLTGPSVRRLPALWPWLAAIPGLALLYLPVSHLVWWSQVEGVIQLADRIIAMRFLPAP
jgi:type VI secretion system protein ImpK